MKNCRYFGVLKKALRDLEEKSYIENEMNNELTIYNN